MIKVTVDNERIKRLKKMVGVWESKIDDARDKAVESALEVIEDTVIEEVTKNYYIGSDEVRKTLKTKSRGNSAWLKSRGPRIQAVQFKLSPGHVVKGYTPKYYMLGVKKSKGLEPLNKSKNKKPFLQKKKSDGKTGLYVRIGGARYPLRPFYAKSIPQMIADADVSNVIQKKAENELYFVLEKEVEKIFGGERI